LGRTVPPGDPASLAQAMLETLANDGLRDRMAGQVEAVRGQLSWMRAVEPVAAFLDRVAYAPDTIDAARKAAAARQTKVYIQQQSERIHSLEHGQQDLLEQVEKLRAHIEAIKQGRVMRLVSAVDRMLGRR
jgi:flagellar motility protein MotE (MotC chaperone)